ncbi:Na+/H+ antiporter subunit E [Acuticoccus sp. M5D2P5]|uniref:Na+/H+ antiporter subunit E n=1 Tax=Acuticoccus kalidii TaxID=2910977 RepID=UPI001F2B094B|nr:Na+/H+ antiporter subunit E [Acuticoccus kalidii]MCF3932803.1 Na+/H+ antiporter subunit E [Acuticoccus kalidii]
MTSLALLPRRSMNVAILTVVFLRELVMSSVTVAKTVLSRDPNPSSAIIAVPLEITTDAGITTLANCVTLTPGTTSLHVSDDRRTLFVHVLDADSEEAVIAEIKEKFERRIKEIEA